MNKSLDQPTNRRTLGFIGEVKLPGINSMYAKVYCHSTLKLQSKKQPATAPGHSSPLSRAIWSW